MSIVSKEHADKILQLCPDLTFSHLEQPVTVSVASPSASLKAICVLQVPIVFENGRSAIFSMLVLPDLAWPFLLGQNYLQFTNAHVRSRAWTVYFADKGLNFEVHCSDNNPVQQYPQLALPQDSSSSTNVTCLLSTLFKELRLFLFTGVLIFYPFTFSCCILDMFSLNFSFYTLMA